jgi:hypothetical protein
MAIQSRMSWHRLVPEALGREEAERNPIAPGDGIICCDSDSAGAWVLKVAATCRGCIGHDQEREQKRDSRD